MRTTLLTSVAAFALLVGGSAWAQQQVPNTGGVTTQPTTPQVPGSTSMDTTTQRMSGEDSHRAYSELDDDARDKVSFQGDWEADQLRDAKVVDKDGDEVGEVEDLLVGSDDRIERVLLDTEAVIDKSDHFVAISLENLKRAEGGDSDELVIDKSKDEIKREFENETAFEKQDERWTRKGS